MLTEWFFVAWPFLLLGFAGFLAWFAAWSVTSAVLAVALSTVFWPAHTKWDTFLHSYMLTAWRKYHSFRYVVVPKDLRAQQPLVLAMYPHGLSPVGQIIFASLSDRLFPGTFVRGFVIRSRRR